MTATIKTIAETDQVTPPANYPPPGWRDGLDASTFQPGWRDQGDYFYVADNLRTFYADSEAAPTQREVQRLYENVPIAGGGYIQVDALVIDADGRYVKSDPVLMIHTANAVFDPNKGWRQPMVTVEPHAGVGTLPYRTWEHDQRLQRATKDAEMARLMEQSYWANLARACPICGTANPDAAPIGGVVIRMPEGLGWHSFQGQQFCQRCLPAVEQAAAAHHYQQYRGQIDRWLDGHITEHQPVPPQRR